MEERKCTKCKEVKPITEFFVKEYSKSGKPCIVQYVKNVIVKERNKGTKRKWNLQIR